MAMWYHSGKLFDHLCGTGANSQLDFNLPERFNLRYRGPTQGDSASTSQFERPVMIHRAILGSLERFIAIITENFAGKWPFWLNPKQVMVIPVAMKYAEYANSVAQKFKDAGLFAEVDESANTLNKMIRNAQVGQWSFVMGMSFPSHLFFSLSLPTLCRPFLLVPSTNLGKNEQS